MILSQKTWSNVHKEVAQEIKRWLIKNGGTEKTVNPPYEVWRIRYSDATITYYSSNKLCCTASKDPALEEVHKFIYRLIGSQFVPPTKEYLIGFDEAGKGEVIGHLVLAGVVISKEVYNELEMLIGTANTKVSHPFEYWDQIYRRLDSYKSRGLRLIVETIPPWQTDKYNINKLLDITYQRMLNLLLENLDYPNVRIVFDDYGIGFHLEKFLKRLKDAGAEVVKTTKADDTYLESRIASLRAKREQQKVIEAISKSEEFRLPGMSLGSGNASDPETINWLKAWKKTGRTWPWFVKKSFKTIMEIDGITEGPEKQYPPINESLLTEEFRERFESGRLDITSLAVVCPSCGGILKLINLIPKDNKTTPICISCNRELSYLELSLTLQYYCGKLLPDTNVLSRGFISKDLDNRRFFENFTFLLHPIVKEESDKHPRGKTEMEKLGRFAAIGRIRLMEIALEKTQKDISNDEAIVEGAKRYHAILLTGDKHMIGRAQAKGVFTIAIK